MNAGEFREAGHRVVDLLAEYLEGSRNKPVFPDAYSRRPSPSSSPSRSHRIPVRRERFWLSWSKSFCLTAPMSGIQAIWG